MRGGRIIKVCGMTLGDNIREVENLGADMIGFIFHEPSPRSIRSLPCYLPVKASRVGVFVNATSETILRRRDEFSLDYVQLHGKESPEFCHELSRKYGLNVMKAFGISGEESLQETSLYEGSCRMFVFDTKTSGYGGSGRSFDWNVLSAYTGKTPFLLSGGISPESVPSLEEFSHPGLCGYDLNSRFETFPGVKDVDSLERFLREIDNFTIK